MSCFSCELRDGGDRASGAKIGAKKKKIAVEKFPRSVPVHSLRVVTDGDHRVLTRSGKFPSLAPLIRCELCEHNDHHRETNSMTTENGPTISSHTGLHLSHTQIFKPAVSACARAWLTSRLSTPGTATSPTS